MLTEELYHVLFISHLQATVDDIKLFVNSKIKVNYKQIRGDILIRNEIPRNSVGKLLRREMRKWAEEEARKE